MAIIKSGATSDQLTIDATSKALRNTPYDSDGTYRGKKQTYRASTVSTVVAPAGTVSFFAISGSATKTIRIQKIRISGFTLTTLAVNDVHVKKYSTILSGGTATALVQVPLDSTFGAGTVGLLNVYTVAPTEGTLVGTIAGSRRIFKSSTVVDGADFPDIEFIFGQNQESICPTLRGTSQYIGVNFGSAPATAVTLTIEVEWTEE